MKNLGMKLLAVVGVVAVIAVAAFVMTAFLTILAVAIVVSLAWWGAGQKVTVKQNGKQIGTLRWFTFTRIR